MKAILEITNSGLVEKVKSYLEFYNIHYKAALSELVDSECRCSRAPHTMDLDRLHAINIAKVAVLLSPFCRGYRCFDYSHLGRCPYMNTYINIST